MPAKDELEYEDEPADFSGGAAVARRYPRPQPAIPRWMDKLTHPAIGYTLSGACALASLACVALGETLHLLGFIPGAILFFLLGIVQEEVTRE